jgi:hypothetical protein
MEFELDGIGGVHLQRVEIETLDRPRYIKSAQTAATKWNAGTQGAGQTWSTGIAQTTKPIVSAAIAARAAMQSNFQTATNPGGTWETRLNAVGDAGIKAAAATAEPMYVAGTLRGQGKFSTAITKIIAAEQNILPSIYAMASGTQAASEQRMLSFSRQMHALKGTLGA